jgi:hypothetical protein
MVASEQDDAPGAADATWTVWRQDDNGNRFVMAQHLGREQAQRMVADFEERGHKQVYWAQPDASR